MVIIHVWDHAYVRGRAGHASLEIPFSQLANERVECPISVFDLTREDVTNGRPRRPPLWLTG